MKVMMLTVCTSLQDGINRHILTISAELARRGVQVAVCTVGAFGELACELKKAGVPTYALNCRNGHDVRLLWRFRKAMLDFRPDVVHCHVTALFARVVLSFCFRNVARVVTVHGIGRHPGLKGKLRKVLERLVSIVFPLHVSITCYVSDGVRRAYDRSGTSARSRTIPNSVGLVKCGNAESLRRRLGLPDDCPVIGTACRIVDVKNPLAFMRVMKMVLDKIQTAHAVIMGTGDERIYREMQALAEEMPRIHLLGYCPNARELLSQCDMFVITSRCEGLPTAALEALISGVPIAFWRGEGGLRDLELINDEDGPIGIVCDQGDEVGLARGIACALSGKTEFSRAKIKALAVRKFSVENTVRDLIRAYDDARKLL